MGQSNPEDRDCGTGTVGSVFFKDGSMLPAILLDVGDNAALNDEAGEVLYAGDDLELQAHVDGEGVVSVEGWELDESQYRRVLTAAFVPESADDVDAFIGLQSMTGQWVLVVRTSLADLCFFVSGRTGGVAYAYQSDNRMQVRSGKGGR